MRAFITGVTGQDGQYLSRYLVEKGYEVYGLVRRATRPANLIPEVKIVEGDITDPDITRVITRVAPDEVYHLAAMSHVGESFRTPRHVFEVNAQGALNVLEGARRVGAAFYQASTSELFGISPPPQYEMTPFHPRSPYGVAKLAAFWATVNYRETYKMFACNGILFNHESPLRGSDFVTQKVCKYVAALKVAKAEKRIPVSNMLALGNLDARRDWGHAKDFVRGMYMLMRHPIAVDVVFATGISRSVRELLDTAFAYIGVADWKPFVIEDPQLLRPADVPDLLGDASFAREVMGWKPEITFEAMIAEMIEAEIVRLSGLEWSPETSA